MADAPTAMLDLPRERQLLGRARAGDRAAIGVLYRSFAPRLYAQVLMPKLGNAQAAEDALSETFRSFIEQLHRVEVDDRSLFHWLARVASNKATDQHRVRARGGRALASFEDMLTPLRDSGEGSPAAQLERSDARRVLRDDVETVLGGLNPRYRRALQLRFLEDRSRQHCAEALEVKLATFDVVLLRALRAFHKAWQVRPAPEEGGAR